MPVKDGLWALTEKEKQTLRLIVRGHDAKSTARCLGLSVHTINERLRDARRKLAVSSSREAARMLFEAEGGPIDALVPDSCGDRQIGDDATARREDEAGASITGAGRPSGRPRILGVLLMTFALALIALAALPHGPAASPAPATSAEAGDAEAVASARAFLTLLDQSRWDDSYRATAESFHQLNTPQVWATASERIRAPLGAMLSRTFVSQEAVPTPPHGYAMVKFRTRFANKADAIETVTLERDAGGWRVAGVTVG